MAIMVFCRSPCLRRHLKCHLMIIILLSTVCLLLLNMKSRTIYKIVSPTFHLEIFNANTVRYNGITNVTTVRTSAASNIKKQNMQPSISRMFVQGLDEGGKRFCNDSFIGYGYETAILHDIIVDTSLTKGRKGGDDFTKLWNQAEDKEFFKFKPGFMRINCKKNPRYVFDLDKHNHNNHWMNAMSTARPGDMEKCQSSGLKNYYIAITRYEYVNLYHTMTDYYNAFLVMKFFNLTGNQTNILIVDGHPWGGLDPVWSVLFNSTIRLGHMPNTTCFKNLIFGIQGYNSLMFRGLERKSIKDIPLTEEFRQFFLSRYRIPERPPLNCSNLSALFLWRRPYYNHPRNPKGDVWRKVNNEKEVVEGVHKAFPNLTLREMQADKLDMKDQVKHINQADILIGMHGSGLSLSMFLPRGRALIELKPAYVPQSGFHHFKLIAGWRGLIYKQWNNRDWELEAPDHYTHVPPIVIVQLIRECIQEMCKS